MSNLEKVFQYLDSIHCRDSQIIGKPCYAVCCRKLSGYVEPSPKYNNLETVLQNLECNILIKNVRKTIKNCCAACENNRRIWPSDRQIFEYNECVNNLKSVRFNSTMNELEQQLLAIRIEKETLTIAEYFSERQLELTKIPIDCLDLCYYRCFPQGAYEKMAKLDQLLNDLKK